MQYKVITRRDGKKSRELVPAISNLLFARATRPVIQEIKRGVQFLQYRTCPENGKNVPIIVPDAQMRQFISVSETFNENLVYLKPEEINLKKGTRVRVIGGAFDGVEGIFVKVRGVRSKRVVVLVEGVTAVAVAEINADLIEIL
jgi:transcription antitermination factor NusG